MPVHVVPRLVERPSPGFELGTHHARFVGEWLLPVVGWLFALYLVALLALVVVTVALKLTGARGSHRALLGAPVRFTTAAVVVPAEPVGSLT